MLSMYIADNIIELDGTLSIPSKSKTSMFSFLSLILK